MVKKKLRLAFFCNEPIVPEWLYSIVLRASESKVAETTLLIFPNNLRKQDILLHKSSSGGSSFYRNFLKKDKTKYELTPNAFALNDLSKLQGLETLELNFSKQEYQLDITTESAQQLIEYKIDIIVNLTGYDMVQSLRSIPVHGVWTYHFGDSEAIEKRSAGVFEFLNNRPTTAIKLVALRENSETVLLDESFSSTDHFSVHRSLNNCLWKASFLLNRSLTKLYANGAIDFFENLSELYASPISQIAPKVRYPAITEIVAGLAANYWRRFRQKIDRKFNFEQYILLFKLGQSQTTTSSFGQFTRILPPKDRFWADPFIIWKNDTYYIFLEELIYTKGLGTIGVIEMDEEGNYDNPQMVLEKDYHLSYPFLIERQGELYMIPESNSDKNIQLYKCVDFPLQWELEEILMSDVHAVDTTIYFYKSKFWMFTNIKEHPGISAYDELFLFYSDTLVGGYWKPHPLNPIVSDVRTARPAGTIFEEDGKLYRPAQNCAKRYGHGMQIAEILTLNEFEYEERIVRSIYPDWGNDLRTTHTINRSKNLTIIDALIGRPK